jgi:hypothetical protein
VLHGIARNSDDVDKLPALEGSQILLRIVDAATPNAWPLHRLIRVGLVLTARQRIVRPRAAWLPMPPAGRIALAVSVALSLLAAAGWVAVVLSAYWD